MRSDEKDYPVLYTAIKEDVDILITGDKDFSEVDIERPDKDTLRKLSAAKSAGGGMLAQCSAAIAVFGDSEKADTWVEDCSIAMSFMMLMAEEKGVGNCWVQIHFRTDASGKAAEENVRDILAVPSGFRIVGILALGIPAEEPKAHALSDADWGKVHRV